MQAPSRYHHRMLEHHAFKAYDVRGTHPNEIDERGMFAIGRALADELEPESVAVGHDMRTMARSCADALVAGLAEAGVQVLDIGMVGTEVLYSTVGDLGLDAGIQVTASHNPAGYIGAKVVRRRAIPMGLDSGLARLRDRALAIHGQLPADLPAAPADRVAPHDPWPAYGEALARFIDPDTIAPMTVVFDAANGMGGRMVESLLEALPITAIRCNFEPDGTFPNHEPNPLLPENRQFILDQVAASGADLGVAWDGDADRCFFIDDTGEFVPGDFTTALIGRHLLERHAAHGSDGDRPAVIHDVRASWAVADTIEAAGGRAVASRVGHAFIKHRMREEDAIFGGEVSGHYYFRDFHFVDSGIIPVLVMLQLVSEAGGSLSALLADLRSRYHLSGEINSRVDDVPLKLQQLKERYADARISHVDGVSIEYEDWRCNIRASNTEPLLRLNLEARSQELMESRRDELLELIRSGSRARL